jgi:glutaredoxin
MIEGVTYEHEEGTRREHAVDLYALSTCGFCRKAIGFLKNNGITFRYVYLDQLPVEEKRALKDELRRRYEIKELFPTLVLDDAKALTGFDREEWEQHLGLV